MRRILLALACATTLAVPLAVRAQDAPPAARRPHIVYFLVDDMSWNDVSWHGGGVRTPTLDELAKSGVRCEQFYTMPLCTPTRAAFLTGRYPMRYGLQSGVITPRADYGLPVEERTLAQGLHDAGYATAICGKWHLGSCEEGFLPTRRGFDRQYGFYGGEIDYFAHTSREGASDWQRDDRPVREEGYSTDLIADEAIRILEGHELARPLFLYVAFNGTHSPLQVPKEWEKDYAGWADADRRTKAAMTTCVDAAIGRVLAALEKRGMRQDTLVVFSSDNGGPERRGEGGDNGDLRGAKNSLYEGGVRVPMVASWPGRLASGTVCDEPLHMVDWYPTLLRLAGAKAEPSPRLDGRDAWPTLAEGKESPHDEILLNLEPKGGALRRGDWKIVVRGPVRGADPEVQLFDLAHDPGEEKDLAEAEPEKARELLQRLRAWLPEMAAPLNRTAGGAGPRRGGK